MITIPLTRDELEVKRAQLATNGITLTGDSGEVNSNGVKADFSYDGTNLSIEVKSKPFIVSKDYVENRIRAWFA